MKKLLLPCALLLLATTTTQAQSESRGDLRWTATEGSVTPYDFGWKLEAMMVSGGYDIGGFNLHVGYTLAEKVVKVEDGVAHVEAEVTALKAKAQFVMPGMAPPGPPPSFDSKEPEKGDKVMGSMAVVLGKKVTFKRAATGEITDFSGGAEIQAALKKEMIKRLKELPPQAAAMAGQTKDYVIMAFGNETLKSTMNVLTHVLPADGKARDEGASWEHPVQETIQGLGQLNFTGKYTTTGVDGGVTRIKIEPTGELKLEKDKSAGNTAVGSQISNHTVKKSSVEGSAEFGPTALVKSQLVQKVLTADPTGNQGMRFSLDLSYTRQSK